MQHDTDALFFLGGDQQVTTNRLPLAIPLYVRLEAPPVFRILWKKGCMIGGLPTQDYGQRHFLSLILIRLLRHSYRLQLLASTST